MSEYTEGSQVSRRQVLSLEGTRDGREERDGCSIARFMGTSRETSLSSYAKWDCRNVLEEKSLAQQCSKTVCRKGQSRNVAPERRAQKGAQLQPGPGLGSGMPAGSCGSRDSSRGQQERLQPLWQRPSLCSDVPHSEQNFFPLPLLPFSPPGPLPVTSCPYSKPRHSGHVPLISPNSPAALPFPLLPRLPWLFLSSRPHRTTCSKGEVLVGWWHLQDRGDPP